MLTRPVGRCFHGLREGPIPGLCAAPPALPSAESLHVPRPGLVPGLVPGGCPTSLLRRFVLELLAAGIPAQRQAVSWDQRGCVRGAVRPHARCSVQAALPRAEAPGSAVCCLTPLAAATCAVTGSKENCALWRENKGFLNLSVLRLAAALRTPCTAQPCTPGTAPLITAAGWGQQGWSTKRPLVSESIARLPWLREHRSSAVGLRASLVCRGLESIARLPWVLPSLLAMLRWLGASWGWAVSVCPGGSAFLVSAHPQAAGTARVPRGDWPGRGGCPWRRGCGSGPAPLPCSASCSEAEERRFFLYLLAAPF